MIQDIISSETNNVISETRPILLSQITPSNFLSFGPGTAPIELRSLNVLIGANGSGKSNLIEAIAFLRAAPIGFQKVTGQGGGVTEWVWKGNPDAEASVAAVLNGANGIQQIAHSIYFGAVKNAFHLRYEAITAADSRENGTTLRAVGTNNAGHFEYFIEDVPHYYNSNNFDFNASMLAQLRDPERYPEFAYLTERYGSMSIYRSCQTDTDSRLRLFQSESVQTARLEEDFSNLKPFLKRLWEDAEAKSKITESLHDLLADFNDLEFNSLDDQVQLFLVERNHRISARRLSDGTLRYLCLLAILCDPNPPPLICIEEPEMSLHTDLLPKLADLLLKASQRTQLIVTTHSDILVDALSEYPETVVVCEKRDGQTQMERLDARKLAVWLEKYKLGDLWISGDLGGKP